MTNKILSYEKNSFLVTGGAGLVGSYIVDQLVENNAGEIIIIDNFSRGRMENLNWANNNGKLKIIKGDILNYELVIDVMSGIDTVFHQAAIRITQCADDPMLAHNVMATGTMNVAKAAVETKVRKVITASSASIYGQAEDFPTKEDHHPYANETFYGATKMYLEGIFRSFRAMYNLDYVAFRYFNIYGPRMDTEGKYTEVIIRWLNCIKNGIRPIIFGDGKTSMDLIHVKDIARANILAMESDVVDAVFNIGSQKEITLKELLELMLKINQCSLKPEFQNERKINSVTRRLADTSRAESDLNFSPMFSLEDGLRELSQWYFNL